MPGMPPRRCPFAPRAPWGTWPALGAVVVIVLAGCASAPPEAGVRPTDGCGFEDVSDASYDTPREAAAAYLDQLQRAEQEDGTSTTASPTPTPRPLDEADATDGVSDVATALSGTLAEQDPGKVFLDVLDQALDDDELVVRGRTERAELYAADSRDSGSLWAVESGGGWVIDGATHPCELPTETSTER